MTKGKVYRCTKDWEGYFPGELVVFINETNNLRSFRGLKLDCDVLWFSVGEGMWRDGTCSSELLEETDLTKQEAQFLMML